MKKLFSVTLSAILLLILTSVSSVSAASTADGYTFTWPVPSSNSIIQRFWANHSAVDITLGTGAAIVAAKDGTVLEVYSGCVNNNGGTGTGCNNNGCIPSYNYWYSSSYGRYFCNNGIGNGVIVKHYDGTYTQYAHMSKTVVLKGQAVKAGELLGFGGSTGCSTGSHIHFEIRSGNNDSNYFGNQVVNSNPITNQSSEGVTYIPSGSAASSKSLTISYVRYPDNLQKGSPFYSSGFISSKNKITRLQAGVYSDSGCTKPIFYYSMSPSTYLFDLFSLDEHMSFSRLAAGKYYYRITATDSSGTVTLTKPFNVGNAGTCARYYSSDGKTVNISSLTLGGGSKSMKVGESKKINCAIYPSNFTISDRVTWSSSNSSVVSVSNGVVTAKKSGYATITAKASNGVYKKCTITVTSDIPEVSTNFSSKTVGIGEEIYIKATSNKLSSGDTVTLASSNSKIATVDSNGKIKGISAGKVTITATSKMGGKATATVTVKPAPTSIRLNKTNLTLGVGEKFDLDSYLSAGSASSRCPYSSSNSAVASVAESGGLVTAKKVGTATITVRTYNGKTATCKVTVKPAPTSIKLNKASITLGLGERFNLYHTLSSASASYGTSYSSSNTAVVTVPQGGGLITANGTGTATITVRTFNGRTASCKVTVKAAPTNVKLNKSSLTLGVGEKFDLDSILPTGSASYKSPYSTSNISVASVAEAGGLVTAKRVGTAIVTVRTYNSKTASCKITVKSAPTSIRLNKTNITLGVGEQFDLDSYLSAGSASYKCPYSSSNPSVASVAEAGGLVTAKKVGTATITVRTYNGRTATCKVTVKAASNKTPVIKLNKANLTLTVGESYTLKPSVTPSKSVTYSYSSSNSAVASVSKGKITAKKAGTATITVKASGCKSATCKVTVKAASKSPEIRLDKTSVTLSVGQTHTLKPSVTPSKSVTYSYSSSNSAVASVSKGKITAKKTGTATITVKANGCKSATCKITVKAASKSPEIKLDKTSVTLSVGQSHTLKPSVTPSKSVTYSYSSSNSDIASVINGKITAKKAGTVTVTVKASGCKSATCKVTVKPAELPAPKNLTATNKKSREIILKWDKVSGADGYELYRSKVSSNSGFSFIKNQTGTSFSNTEMTVGTKYYYKVRAFKNVSGKKVYSDCSLVSIKVSK